MKLPAVLDVDVSEGDRVTLALDVVADLEAFRGHFPGNPILPGVVQLDWVMRFAQIYLGCGDRAAQDFQVKFRNIIHPNAPLSLTLQLDRAKNRLAFTYKSNEVPMASGYIKRGTET